MISELLMNVDFIFESEEKRIVGGAAPHYPTDDYGWLNFIGKDILIQSSKGDLFFKVKKIDVFTSIAGRVNICLTLDADKQFDVITKGDRVYKILEP